MSPKVFSLHGQGLKLDTRADIESHLAAVDPTEIEEIHFGGNTIGVDASAALAEFLQKANNLKIADFADIFTGRLISEIPLALTAICDALKDKTSLVEINLSDNAFGGRSVDPIVPFLTHNRSFQILKLNNNGLGPAGGVVLANALLESAKLSKAEGKPSNLRTVICGRNRLENGSAPAWAGEAFAAHGALQEIRMPQNGIRMEGITALAQGLAKCPDMREIDLQDNAFIADGELEGVEAWTEALAQWPELTTLNMSDCVLSADGEVPTIVTALAGGSNPKLHTLQLQNNNLESTSFMALSGGIGKMPVLTRLELQWNEVEEDDEYIAALATHLKSRGGKLIASDEDEEEDEKEKAEAAAAAKTPTAGEDSTLDELTSMLDKRCLDLTARRVFYLETWQFFTSAMFKFGFDVDEEDQATAPELAQDQESSKIVQVEPFSELSVSPLLDALPPLISYSPVSIQLSSKNAVTSIARRDLFDARFQLISAGAGPDGEQAPLPEDDASTSALKFLESPSDLVPGVYEGGLKTWECSLDLVNYLDGVAGSSEGSYFVGKRILEVGCGSAIPSTYIANRVFHEPPADGAEIYLQDYNASVLELITFPNILLAWYMSPASREYQSSAEAAEAESTLPAADAASPGELQITPELKAAFIASLEKYKLRLRFFSGPWEELTSQLTSGALFDIVLTSETIYRLDSVPALIALLHAASGEQTICLVAAKVLYFGVGGGVSEFVGVLESERKGTARTVWERTLGVGRKILQIEWHPDAFLRLA
ncbi:hypothetical protein MKEN_01052600 [Mycena kentingensis (nom. inval.)]|nr:hypothetical protein MKEN_01052600 [Mycena kentingensis (nom. inval.)]